MKFFSPYNGQIISHIPYKVLNERSIRATAGILFVIGISTMRWTLLTNDRTFMEIVVPIFRAHFIVITIRWPKFSPFSWIGKWLVHRQNPEWIGATQKRFERWLWIILATAMMVCVFIVPTPRYILLSICGTCLLFMWIESAVGFCVGCHIYGRSVRKWRITDHSWACSGGVCPK